MNTVPEPSYVQKFKRAHAHGETLDDAIETFRKANPCPVREQFYPESKQRIWRVDGNPPDPNIIWSPTFGEFFYNARSALDHLIWAVATRYGKPPKSNLLFPIFPDALEFAFKMREPLKLLPTDALTVIERAQPYNGSVRPDRHSLSLLNKLGNTDKHERPNLTTYATDGWGTVGEVPEHIKPWIGPVKRGTVLLVLPVKTDEDMHMGFDPSFDVAFGDPPADFTTIRWVVRLILRKVEVLIEGLAPFL